jgi:hypothetical protein
LSNPQLAVDIAYRQYRPPQGLRFLRSSDWAMRQPRVSSGDRGKQHRICKL